MQNMNFKALQKGLDVIHQHHSDMHSSFTLEYAGNNKHLPEIVGKDPHG